MIVDGLLGSAAVLDIKAVNLLEIAVVRSVDGDKSSDDSVPLGGIILFALNFSFLYDFISCNKKIMPNINITINCWTKQEFLKKIICLILLFNSPLNHIICCNNNKDMQLLID